MYVYVLYQNRYEKSVVSNNNMRYIRIVWPTSHKENKQIICHGQGQNNMFKIFHITRLAGKKIWTPDFLSPCPWTCHYYYYTEKIQFTKIVYKYEKQKRKEVTCVDIIISWNWKKFLCSKIIWPVANKRNNQYVNTRNNCYHWYG